MSTNRETIGVVASCGHEVAFTPKDGLGDRPDYLSAKIAKIQGRSCSACRIEAEKRRVEQERCERGVPEGSQKRLPVGTLIVIKKDDDGMWVASLQANDRIATNKSDSLNSALYGLLSRANRYRRAKLIVGPTIIREPPPAHPRIEQVNC